MDLTNAQIAKLKGIAQRMDATLKVGRAGLSESFLQTVRETLAHRELIKVKFDEFKEQKKTLARELAEKTESRLVTLIGNVAVLYRQNPNPVAEIESAVREHHIVTLPNRTAASSGATEISALPVTRTVW
ncbi:MAG TPA: YhbY family RNA-binding protein [Verrucomicrobiae bacterium]|jgi:RNA-binding protein